MKLQSRYDSCNYLLQIVLKAELFDFALKRLAPSGVDKNEVYLRLEIDSLLTNLRVDEIHRFVNLMP